MLQAIKDHDEIETVRIERSTNDCEHMLSAFVGAADDDLSYHQPVIVAQVKESLTQPKLTDAEEIGHINITFEFLQNFHNRLRNLDEKKLDLLLLLAWKYSKSCLARQSQFRLTRKEDNIGI